MWKWYTCYLYSFLMIKICNIKNHTVWVYLQKLFKCILYKNLQVKSGSKTMQNLNLPSSIFAKILKPKKGVERNNENILRVVWKEIKTYPSTRMKFLMCFCFNLSWNIIETCSHISVYNNSTLHKVNFKMFCFTIMHKFVLNQFWYHC